MDALTTTSLVVMVIAATLFVVGVYNHLVRLRNQCDNAFSQIEVQLKRRHDLIPSLVECVKGAMIHERETLERVIAARSQAIRGLEQAIRQPTDRQTLAQWMGAEGSLAGALGRLSVAIEGYPDLKANTSVAALAEQLTSTENRIAYARQSYNDWASGFNDARQTFPTCVLARLIGFDRDRNLLEFADREALVTPPNVVLA